MHKKIHAVGLAIIWQAGACAAESMILYDDLEDPAWKPEVATVYKRVDGLDLPLVIFQPRDRAVPLERRPAVLCLHGGAWGGYQGGDWRSWNGGILAAHARHFAVRGAVGVAFTYRHVARPAQDRAGFEEGPSVFDLLADCRSALRFLRVHADEFGIDPTRMAALGDSAGGHLTAGLGTIDAFDQPGEDTTISGMANATIPCNAIMDLTDPRWITFVPETPRTWEADTPLSREERARRGSPLDNVSARSAPSLVIHGLKDTVVALPIEHACLSAARHEIRPHDPEGPVFGTLSDPERPPRHYRLDPRALLARA